MRGAVVGGSGAVNGGYFCRGLPSDFDGWGMPGWAWADVLPHFLAIETDLDFEGPLHGGAGPDQDSARRRIRWLHSYFRGCGDRGGLSVDRGPQRIDAGCAAAVGRRCGTAEHQRRHAGRPGRGLPETRDGSHRTHSADRYPGQTDQDRRWPGGRGGVRRARRNRRPDRGPNRPVGRCYRIGASADAVGHRPAADD